MAQCEVCGNEYDKSFGTPDTHAPPTLTVSLARWRSALEVEPHSRAGLQHTYQVEDFYELGLRPYPRPLLLRPCSRSGRSSKSGHLPPHRGR
jgi:hypothetical protein